MADKIRFENDAVAELNKAMYYFDSFGKGEQFLNDFENQIALLITMPDAFQVRYRKVRIISLEYFSYTIHYTNHKGNIIILNILNQYQDY